MADEIQPDEWCAGCRKPAPREAQQEGWKYRGRWDTLYCSECVDIVDTEEIMDG